MTAGQVESGWLDESNIFTLTNPEPPCKTSIHDNNKEFCLKIILAFYTDKTLQVEHFVQNFLLATKLNIYVHQFICSDTSKELAPAEQKNALKVDVYEVFNCHSLWYIKSFSLFWHIDLDSSNSTATFQQKKSSFTLYIAMIKQMMMNVGSSKSVPLESAL